MGIPVVSVLGFAERASYVRDGTAEIFKWNIIGLKSVVVGNMYPLTVNDGHIVIAVRGMTPGQTITLRVTEIDGTEVGHIRVDTEPVAASDTTVLPKSAGPKFLVPDRGWIPVVLSLNATEPMVIPRPAVYLVTHQESGDVVGQLHFALAAAVPLTPERVAAIKSDPQAVKAVRAEFGCRKCGDKFRVYAALEKIQKLESEGWVWWTDLPDNWRCRCGQTNHHLTIVRSNITSLLGRPLPREKTQDLNYLPLYEKSALEHLSSEFDALLGQNPGEEILQKYIEENPVLLHQFPSDKLFFKPPVLTFFKCDFAIVTPQRELVLIEIEKTTTRLLKKDGGEASEVRHAFDQVVSWLHVVDEHRLAVLDSLGIDRTVVSSVRGVVIAGRDMGYDPKHLSRLKGVDRGRVTLLTYDDLSAGLRALIRGMHKL